MNSFNRLLLALVVMTSPLTHFLRVQHARHKIRTHRDFARDARKHVEQNQRDAEWHDAEANRVEKLLLTGELEACRTRQEQLENRIRTLAGDCQS